MQNDVIVLIYGRGGHQAQMQRLLAKNLILKKDNIALITMTDSSKPISHHIEQIYIFNEFRDKYSNWVSLWQIPVNSVRLMFTTLSLLYSYKVRAVITTGPGLAIVPCIIFWLFGKKLIVFETWSKFYKATFTARILHKFAGLFIIQNKSLKSVFPDARYWGRL